MRVIPYYRADGKGDESGVAIGKKVGKKIPLPYLNSRKGHYS
jgi:hypothetical protein